MAMGGRRLFKQTAAGCTLFLLLGLFPGGSIRAQGSPDTSVVATPKQRGVGISPCYSPFDTLSIEGFRKEHAFSLDHFLERVPGYVMGREGSIGADTRLSRFGMGSGRSRVCYDGIPLNDPQSDLFPLAFFPTGFLGSLRFDDWGSFPFGEGIEGSLNVLPPRPPAAKPSVAVELSRGSNDIKQRRVRFSSVESDVGVDIGYDELLDDGYQFDLFGRSLRDLGRFSARIYSLRLRGDLAEEESYDISFLRFSGAFLGLLGSRTAETRHRGHLAVAGTRLGGMEVRGYQREMETALADSLTASATVGVAAFYRLERYEVLDLALVASVEQIASSERIGDVAVSPRLDVVSGGVISSATPWGIESRLELSVKHQIDHAVAWGGRALFRVPIARANRASLVLSERYRLPNLSELFSPLHRSPLADSLMVVGNEELSAEKASEAFLLLSTSLGPIENEIGLGVLEVADPILSARSEEVQGATARYYNGPRQRMNVLLERFLYEGALFGVRLGLRGGIVLADRGGGEFFGSVPMRRVDVSLHLNRDLFPPSTDVTAGIRYQHSSSRSGKWGYETAGYDVLDLKFDLRLLGAHLYLLLLNALDEEYATAGPYIMTPRTFVYGVQWTLFE